MRISDWSSDVCSSDLRTEGEARCLWPAIMIVDHRRNARRIGIACLGEFGMRPRGAGVDREARRTIAGDGRAAGILQCLPRTSEIGAESRGIHRENALRSEEHTSELQSLMRISYAVFCLKKK